MKGSKIKEEERGKSLTSNLKYIAVTGGNKGNRIATTFSRLNSSSTKQEREKREEEAVEQNQRTLTEEEEEVGMKRCQELTPHTVTFEGSRL